MNSNDPLFDDNYSHNDDYFNPKSQSKGNASSGIKPLGKHIDSEISDNYDNFNIDLGNNSVESKEKNKFVPPKT
jgi:hypothetical protein